MARKKSRPSKESDAQKTQSAGSAFDDAFAGGLESDDQQSGQTTGRLIMTVTDAKPDEVKAAMRTMSNRTGRSAAAANVMNASDFDDADFDKDGDVSDANYVVLDELGIVIMNVDPDERSAAMTATAQDDSVIVEPEYWNFPLGFEMRNPAIPDAPRLDPGDTFPRPGAPDGDVFSGASREFLTGARAMIDLLLQQDSGSSAADINTAQQRCIHDSRTATWGVHATEVDQSSLSGHGVKVAVLDTGFDVSHPDFGGRTVHRASFIPSSEPDNDANDRNGHGTHCIGTACGSRTSVFGPRYGIAHEAEIFSGKVLRQDASGRAAGADGWILAGMNWALSNGCELVSMSLGSRANSASFPMNYEMAARRGLQAGTLIIAASGNDSRRQFGHIDPVGRPANCPSIAAVAAIDNCFRVASFSNGQRFGNGGEINFSGPGVAVLSSSPMPRGTTTLNGTSMATPHAAGIAALICQQTGFRGIDLYREMRRRTLRLGNPRDFGNGLVRV